ncbi:hypothetical protein [Streptomyces sp. NPDC057257]|uniref:hypothetical protein n=1 Tax=Streptomyces sp. NPDC057257 TaxID=3346071 RepID=UPI0036254F4F
MKWAMSDDYAALITTVILFVLAVGTVQTYTFLKQYADAAAEWARQLAEVRSRVLSAIRAGDEPENRDMERVGELTEDRPTKGFPPAYIAAGLWLALCTTLVGVQAKVLLWAATDGHSKDPHLARLSFFVSCAAMGVLTAEGLVRAWLRGRSGLRRYALDDEEDAARYQRALADYQASHASTSGPVD